MLDYNKLSIDFTNLLSQFDASRLEKWVQFDKQRTIEYELQNGNSVDTSSGFLPSFNFVKLAENAQIKED